VSVEDTLINRWIWAKMQPRTPQTHASPDKLISEFQALQAQALSLMRQWEENDLQKTYSGPQGDR
jgi:hypothetical protein